MLLCFDTDNSKRFTKCHWIVLQEYQNQYSICLLKTEIPRRLHFHDIDFLNKYSECRFKHVTGMVRC